jgi:hypothetical protein
MFDSIWIFIACYLGALGVLLYLAVKTDEFGKRQGSYCTWGQLFRGDPWRK